MRTAAWAICISVLLFGMMCQPISAATAQARACAEVVGPVLVCGSSRGEYVKASVRMSATRPEVICLPDTVAKFDIVGGKDVGCSIILPRELDIHDSAGRRVATCIFSSVMGQSKPDSPVVGVVIKADIEPSQPNIAPCSADFDVIVAYD